MTTTIGLTSKELEMLRDDIMKTKASSGESLIEELNMRMVLLALENAPDNVKEIIKYRYQDKIKFSVINRKMHYKDGRASMVMTNWRRSIVDETIRGQVRKSDINNLHNLKLSTATFTKLKKAGISGINELHNMTIGKLVDTNGLGIKQSYEIIEAYYYFLHTLGVKQAEEYRMTITG